MVARFRVKLASYGTRRCASRALLMAGLSGFFTLIQSRDGPRPLRRTQPLRHDAFEVHLSRVAGCVSIGSEQADINALRNCAARCCSVAV
jgi:hypothetical protein